MFRACKLVDTSLQLLHALVSQQKGLHFENDNHVRISNSTDW